MTPGRRARLAALSLLLLAAAGPAPPAPNPAPTQAQLQEAERARAALLDATRAAAAKAATAAAESQRLSAQRVTAAARLRTLEDATGAAASQIEQLAERQRQAEARLAARAAQIAPLLPVIERLSLYPSETLLSLPMPPDAAVRGVLVLGGISRQLEADAAALRAEQQAVTQAQAALRAELPNLAAAKAAQARGEAELDAQIAAAQQARQSAEDAGADAARRAADEAAKAATLRTAIARIEDQRRVDEARARAEAEAAERQKRQAALEAAQARQLALAQPAGPGLGAPRGALVVPVAGSVLRGFGEATEAGPANGLSYQSAPGARVVSPCAGRVVFAGPFRSFGLLLIVDCGGGYHFVLSGFERLDASVGTSVQAGEPVGVMPGWDPLATAHGATGRPSLYVELRHDGQPVNPAPFLRAKSPQSG